MTPEAPEWTPRVGDLVYIVREAGSGGLVLKLMHFYEQKGVHKTTLRAKCRSINKSRSSYNFAFGRLRRFIGWSFAGPVVDLDTVPRADLMTFPTEETMYYKRKQRGLGAL